LHSSVLVSIDDKINDSSCSSIKGTTQLGISQTRTISEAETETAIETAADRFTSFLARNGSFRHTQRELIREWYNISNIPLDSDIENDNDVDNDVDKNKQQKQQLSLTRTSMLIVNGPPESGKTDLVTRTLRSLVTGTEGYDCNGGYFISASFDFLQHQEPYKAFLSAITEFIHAVVSRGDDEIDRMRNVIQASMTEDDIIVVSNMIPPVELIINSRIDYIVMTHSSITRNRNNNYDCC
jgi:hypothetical protein